MTRELHSLERLGELLGQEIHIKRPLTRRLRRLVRNEPLVSDMLANAGRVCRTSRVQYETEYSLSEPLSAYCSIFSRAMSD